MTLRSALSLSVLACALAVTSGAHADSLPMCPPGTRMVANPTPPGAMHHGGAHCEPDGAAAPTTPPPEAPVAPEAPIGTPPSETPPSTPEAALPTAPASTASVPAPASPTTTEPAPSGMCSVRGGADTSLLALGLVSGALSFVRRRR
jgi:hypothetical protein